MPVGELDHGAADERAEGDGDAGDAGPDAERDAAFFRREGARDQGQGERGDDRRADALDRPGGDQEVGARGERGGRRGGGEEGDAGDEHAPAAEAVTERGAGQQHHPVGEDVGVDGPLQGLHGGAEVVVDGGEGDVHDEVVEHDHEQPHGDQDEGPEPSFCLCLRFHRRRSFRS